jgi:adenine-specific DNA methylase
MKISKQETIMVSYIFEGVKSYIVTRNVLGKYTLYKVLDNDYQKLKTDETPVKFEEIIEKDRSK